MFVSTVLWGTVGQWFSGTATLLAVAVALWLPHRQRRLEAKRERLRAQDELRRLIYIAIAELHRRQLRRKSRGGAVEGLSGELIGTIINSVAHHHELASDAELDELNSALITSHALDEAFDRAVKALEGIGVRLNHIIDSSR